MTMPLFDASTPIDAAPAEQLAIAHAFLQRCQDWALDKELPRLREALQSSNDPADAAKLHQWLTWLAFTSHALRELEDGTLDHWFLPSPPDALPDVEP